MLLTIREHINSLSHKGRLNRRIALAAMDLVPDSPALDKLESAPVESLIDILSAIHMAKKEIMDETGIYPPAEEDKTAQNVIDDALKTQIFAILGQYERRGRDTERIKTSEVLDICTNYYQGLQKEAARAERQASRRYTAPILKELERRGYTVPFEQTGKLMCGIIPMLPWKELLGPEDIEAAVDQYLDTRTQKQMDQMFPAEPEQSV